MCACLREQARRSTPTPTASPARSVALAYPRWHGGGALAVWLGPLPCGCPGDGGKPPTVGPGTHRHRTPASAPPQAAALWRHASEPWAAASAGPAWHKQTAAGPENDALGLPLRLQSCSLSLGLPPYPACPHSKPTQASEDAPCPSGAAAAVTMACSHRCQGRRLRRRRPATPATLHYYRVAG